MTCYLTPHRYGTWTREDVRMIYDPGHGVNADQSQVGVNWRWFGRIMLSLTLRAGLEPSIPFPVFKLLMNTSLFTASLP
jgi:hypothetical protein